MTDPSKRGSLQCPCEALHGVRQLKKKTKNDLMINFIP